MITNLGDFIAGTPGYGQLARFNDISDAASYSVIIGNADTTNGLAFQSQYGPAASPTILVQHKKAALVHNLPLTIKQSASLSDPGANYGILAPRSDGNWYGF